MVRNPFVVNTAMDELLLLPIIFFVTLKINIPIMIYFIDSSQKATIDLVSFGNLFVTTSLCIFDNLMLPKKIKGIPSCITGKTNIL